MGCNLIGWPPRHSSPVTKSNRNSPNSRKLAVYHRRVDEFGYDSLSPASIPARIISATMCALAFKHEQESEPIAAPQCARV